MTCYAAVAREEKLVGGRRDHPDSLLVGHVIYVVATLAEVGAMDRRTFDIAELPGDPSDWQHLLSRGPGEGRSAEGIDVEAAAGLVERGDRETRKAEWTAYAASRERLSIASKDVNKAGTAEERRDAIKLMQDEDAVMAPLELSMDARGAFVVQCEARHVKAVRR